MLRRFSTSLRPVLSIVKHPYALPSAPIAENEIRESLSPIPSQFAVVEYSGTQYKVTIDDLIIADHVEGLDIGQTIHLDKVFCYFFFMTILRHNCIFLFFRFS